MKKRLAVLGVVVAVVGLGYRADAALVTTRFAEINANVYNGDVLTTDLINAGQSSYAGGTFTGTAAGGSFDAVHDGAASTSSMSSGLYINGTFPVTLEFNLNLDPATGGSAQGYNLTKIQTIAAWTDNVDYAGQHAQIFVKPVGGQYAGWFMALTAVVNDPAAGNWGMASATETVLTDDTGILAPFVESGIGAVRFIYNAPYDSSNRLMLQEIDIVGSPVPEPTSLAVLATGGILLAQRRRWA